MGSNETMNLKFNLLSGKAHEDTTELGSNYSIPPVHTHYIPIYNSLHSTHSVDFWRGRKTGEPREKPSWHEKEQHIKQT